MQKYFYDVFLSHHSDDKPQVEALARRLLAVGINPFLDSWHLVPGRLWQKDLETAITNSRTCAVIVGAHGFGPWAEQEMFLAQSQQVSDPSFRVIPVLLPGAQKPGIPGFLAQRTWVEFRGNLGDKEAFRRLVSGIRDQPPMLHTARPTGNETSNTESSLLPNPFGDQGRITDPTRFFDREGLFGQILLELRQGRNVSLVGEAQIGKSSILTQICVRGPALLRRPAADFVLLDLETLTSDDDFFESLGEKLGLVGLGAWRLKRALDRRRVILCLDEIEKMTYKGFTSEVRAQLRGLADGNEAPFALLIASRTGIEDLFPDNPLETSPLASICTQVPIGPFSPDAAYEFLRHRLSSVGRQFSVSELKRLVVESGGHPGRLQSLAHSYFNG